MERSLSVLQMIFMNPAYFVGMALFFIYSLIAHELSHAVIAYAFGDRTAKAAGRITLNPFAHLDPVGSIMLLVVGFGWANPVPINPDNFRYRRLGMFCVSLAGCAANILIATGLLLVLASVPIKSELIFILLMRTIQTNIILGAFNLIPLPPLDGSKMLMSVLPSSAQAIFMRIEPYGFFILIAFLFTGLLDPAILFIQNVIMGAITLLLRSLPLG